MIEIYIYEELVFTEFKLPYGNSFKMVRIPSKNITGVLTRQHASGLADEYGEIVKAIRNPLGSRPLADRINGNDKVIVLVTDNTRACPDDRLLPPMLSELERRVPKKNIDIIIALGLHAPLTEQEMIAKLGPEIISSYQVSNHDSKDTVFIGTTTRGTPVEISRRVLQADFCIATGFIEPHFFAGFSGGRKSMVPGVAGSRTIYHNHGYEMMEHPLSRAGVLQGNPIHEDMVEMARMAGLDYIVNVLLNESKQITHVVAGDPVLAHEEGCRIEKKLAGARVDSKVDITITTNSGAPLDLDLYQTCKGIDNASLITREGGSIIIASVCDRGVGPDAFTRPHLSCRTPHEVLEKLEREGHVHLPWQNQRLAHAQINHDIYLVSDLDDELVKRMMIVPVASVEEGLEKAFVKLGKAASVAVIPEGPLVLPFIEDTNDGSGDR